MSKKIIALIFGGVSSEHEVSCMSVASVAENIDKEKYEPLLLGITKEGEWYLYSGEIEKVRNNTWEEDKKRLKRAFICPDRSVHGIMVEEGPAMFPRRINAVFPVLHGRNGEDGSMQGLLEIAGIPYVGCRVLSSAMCMDKDICHAVLKNAGIPQVKWLTFMKGCNLEHAFDSVSTELGFPVFVKPANAGSSVGITKAKSREELPAAFELAFENDCKIIVEEAVKDPIEVECAVFGNRELSVGGPGEIVPADEFYSYNAKYYNAESKLYIPARLSDEKAEEIRKIARQAYSVLGCRGLTRVDFLVERESGKVVLNEPNTLPGFTNISMYPKLMMAAGMSYSELITGLIELAEAEFSEE